MVHVVLPTNLPLACSRQIKLDFAKTYLQPPVTFETKVVTLPYGNWRQVAVAYK